MAVVYERVKSGEPSLLLVAGEAGIGKTTLVSEFLRRAGEARVAVGHCVGVGGAGLPYAPLVEVLGDLVRADGPEAVIRAAGPWRADLARLLPALGVAAAESEQARARLFEGVVALMEALSSDRPLTVVLEDLHWADDSTLELVRFAVGALRGSSLLIVGTFRSDELTRRHRLTPVLAELERSPRVRRIDLRRLTSDEVADLVTARLGRAPSPTVLDDVARRSDGVPFYAEELTRSYAQRPRSSAATARDRPPGLPGSLSQALHARLDALSAAALRLVQVAAVGGESVEETDVAAVAGLDAGEADAALAEAVDAHVLAVGPERRGYRFQHALLREVALDDLLPGQLGRLHVRWAEQLEARDTGRGSLETLVRLAHHWYAAPDLPRAFRAALDAAAVVRSAAAPDEEQLLLERALALWDVVPDAELVAGVDRVAVQARASEAAVRAGEPARAVALLDAALAGADATSSPLRHAGLLLDRSEAAWALGNPGTDEANAALARLDDVEPSPEVSRVRSRALGLLAMRHNWGGEFATAQRLARAAVEEARRADSVRDELMGLRQQANALLLLGRPGEEYLPLYRNALPLAERLGDPEQRVNAQFGLAMGLAGVGRLRAAARLARDARQTAAQQGMRRKNAAHCATLEAEMYLRLGEWDDASTLCHEVLATAPLPTPQLWLRRLAAMIATLRGDPTAGQLVDAACEAMEQVEDAWETQHNAEFRALTALEAGDLTSARAAVEDELTNRDGIRYPDGTEWFLHVAARVLAAGTSTDDVGSSDQAAEVLAWLQRLPVVPDTHRWSALIQAELATAPAPAAQAWAHAVDVLCQPDVEGFAHQKAYAHYRHGLSLLELGHQDEATTALAAAQRAATRLKALPLLRRIADASRSGRLGVPPPDPTGQAPAPDNPFGLTPREYEVLVMLAAGLSNGQIAEKLYISPKTASVHVSNILTKTGADNRHDAARIAAEHGILPDTPT